MDRAWRKVANVMTRAGLATCEPGQSLRRAAQLLLERDCGALPVVEDGVVIGMLTDRDVCLAAWRERRPLSELEVACAMSSPVHGCADDDELSEALGLMRRYQVRRLPVLDRGGRLVGLLSQDDVIRAAARRRSPRLARCVVETLSMIGEPPRLARTQA